MLFYHIAHTLRSNKQIIRNCTFSFTFDFTYELNRQSNSSAFISVENVRIVLLKTVNQIIRLHCKFDLLILLLVKGFFRMIRASFNQPFNYDSIVRGDRDLKSRNRVEHFSIRIVRGGHDLKINDHFYKSYGLCSSNSRAASRRRILRSLRSNPSDSRSTSKESALILIRHGESMWNEKNLFTGCVDVPLTKKGVVEAIEAGKRISNLPLDIIYISALIRSQMTAMLALTQHRCMKVPIIMHNETEQARTWSQVYTESTKKQSIPVVKAWQLNERMYGDLQGLNKAETAEKYGREQVHSWRRSYYVRPPNGESLEMCLGRAVTFFKEHIEPQLMNGKHVMVVAHANSLRSIIMYLDKLTSEEVINLELSTGVPMLYIYKEGNFLRRGSPHGSSEAGVYAYTESLSLYRQELDEILH